MARFELTFDESNLDAALHVSEDEILKRKFCLNQAYSEDFEKTKLTPEEAEDIWNRFQQTWLEATRKGGFKPSLKDLTNFLCQDVIGERQAVLAGQILYDNGVPLLFEGKAGSGKSSIMNAIEKSFYPSLVYTIDAASEQAIVYDWDVINKAKYIIIPEVNKLGDMKSIMELLKNWGEGKDYTRRVANGGSRTSDKMTLKCKVFMYSLATESKAQNKLGEELNSRGMSIYTNMSQMQTRAILDFQSEAYESSKTRRNGDPVEKMMFQHFIGTLPSVGLCIRGEKYDYDVLIPGSKYMNTLLPDHIQTVTRDNEKFMKGIIGIMRFHHYDRMTFINERGNETLIATPQDVFIAYKLFGKMIVDSAKKVSRQEEIIMNYIAYNPGCSVRDIRPFMSRYGYPLNATQLKSMLDNLIEYSYIEDSKSGNMFRYNTTELYTTTFNKIPNFRECINSMLDVLKKEVSQEVYDEYYNRYCTPDKLKVKDPLGEEGELDIINHDFSLASEELKRIAGLEKWV